jgi:DNA polymerase-3 subunit epsilon
MYAIVDIETTGGHADRNGITEIAIFTHDGTRVIDSYTTLINPGIPIPPFLETYTGITNEMVEQAPTFEMISDKVYEMLHDKIFVAHNVNFDHTFIKHHLQHAGLDLNVKKLCTVRLSRKVFPGFNSYSLGNLCQSLGIPLQNRHRAHGDAAATVKVLERAFKADTDGSIINSFLKKGSKEATLPPNLPKEDYLALPETPGVYYFYDDQGKIIYVGKAINIKKRVLSHFIGNAITAKRQDLLRDLKHIGHEPTGSEFQALILESLEIKKHWPKHNKALKTLEFNYAIYDYEDQNGYIRIAVDKSRKHSTPVQTYPKLNDAFKQLQKIVFEFNLCPKLCLINAAKEPCAALIAGCCIGACQLSETAESYNQRANAAITHLQKNESYAIIDKGISPDNFCCILINEGKFYGMSYLSHDTPLHDLEELKSYITPQKDNYFIKELVKPEKLAGFKLINF